MKLNTLSILCCVFACVLPVAAFFSGVNETFGSITIFSSPLLLLTVAILAFIAWRKGADKSTAMVLLIINLLLLTILIIFAYIFITGFADMLN
jgi:hypothetical protein